MRLDSRHRHESSKRATSVALVLSVLLHLPLISLIYLVSPDEESLTRTNFDAQSAFEIDVVTQDEEEPKKEPTEEETDDAMQFVSLPRPEVEERPEEAKFADRFDESVEEQTVKKALPGAPARVTPPEPQPVEQTNPQDAEGETEEEATEDEVAPRELAESGVSATEESKEAAPSRSPRRSSPPSTTNRRPKCSVKAVPSTTCATWPRARRPC